MTAADWRLLASGTTWVIGAAIVLSAASWHQWQAATTGRHIRDAWRASSWQRWHAVGMMLVAIGFGSMPGTPAWERAVWLVVGLVFAGHFWGVRRPKHGAGTRHG